MKEILKIEFDKLYTNCVYSSIAHAIFILKEPFFSYTQSWDGDNYSFNYGSTRGTISFYQSIKVVVGAARDERSIRRRLYPEYNAITMFNGSSDDINKLALQDPLEYLYDEVDGVTKPMATIGFWLENDIISSNDDVNLFKDNGGEYLFIISQSFDGLVRYWNEQYDFNDEEHEIADYIYKCWLSKSKIKHKEVKKVIQKKCVGFRECLESLKEIGIIIS